MAALSVSELARRLGAELVARDTEARCEISGVALPEAATAADVVVLFPTASPRAMQSSRAAAFVVTAVDPDCARPQLVTQDPRRALGLLLEWFSPTPADEVGIHALACVDHNAQIDSRAWVGPFAYVAAGAVVAAGCRVEPFSYVGKDVQLGPRSQVGPHAVVLEGSVIGADAVIGPGAVIGHAGFGYWREADGWRRLRSNGSVEISAAAEVGANSCVDRATLGATRVGRGAKLDNLVQVGHNAAVGEEALLCAQVGVAGSAQVGDGVLLGGQVGVADHVNIGRGARVGAQSGVASDVREGHTVSGYPAIDHRRWLRASAIFGRLGELSRRLGRLGDQLAVVARAVHVDGDATQDERS